MTMIERVENVNKLWSLLLPTCPAPLDYQIGRWVSRFSDSEIEYAIGRTATKFRNGLPADATTVPRYTTGIMNNERVRKGIPA